MIVLTVLILVTMGVAAVMLVVDVVREPPRRTRREVTGRPAEPVAPARMKRLHVVDDPERSP